MQLRRHWMLSAPSSVWLRKSVGNPDLPCDLVGLAAMRKQRDRSVSVVLNVTFGQVRRVSTIEVARAGVKLPRSRASKPHIRAPAEDPRRSRIIGVCRARVFILAVRPAHRSAGVEIHEAECGIHVRLDAADRNLNLRPDAAPENVVASLDIECNASSNREVGSVKSLASILHPADVTANAENSFTIETEKGAYVDAKSIGVDLRRELTFRLCDESIDNN